MTNAFECVLGLVLCLFGICMMLGVTLFAVPDPYIGIAVIFVGMLATYCGITILNEND